MHDGLENAASINHQEQAHHENQREYKRSLLCAFDALPYALKMFGLVQFPVIITIYIQFYENLLTS